MYLGVFAMEVVPEEDPIGTAGASVCMYTVSD
jgi:hypothetical protein